jgi:hypothetical protein
MLLTIVAAIVQDCVYCLRQGDHYDQGKEHTVDGLQTITALYLHNSQSFDFL